MSIVLASSSATRADLLRKAGVEVTVDAARIDEAAVKAGAAGRGRAAP